MRENYLGYKVETIIKNEPHSAELVFRSVVDAAAEYFSKCPGDFLIQHFTEEGIVFGGTNRLIWKPAKGFYPDRSYCTQEFLEHYNKIQKEM